MIKRLLKRLVTGALSLWILGACQSTPPGLSTGENPQLGEWKQHGIVIIAVDIRERTSLRENIRHLGSVFFRRVDAGYAARARGDYDFGVQYTLGADWRGLVGEDENRAARLFRVEPGEYVIERIDIGSGPTTRIPGFDERTRRALIGGFSIRAGEVKNLGRLIVHMHFREGVFVPSVQDNSAEVAKFLAARYPSLVPLTRTDLIRVVPRVPYGR